MSLESSEPPTRTDDVKVADDLTFTKYLLSDSLLNALKELNFVKPSPIQSRILPLVKCGLGKLIVLVPTTIQLINVLQI